MMLNVIMCPDHGDDRSLHYHRHQKFTIGLPTIFTTYSVVIKLSFIRKKNYRCHILFR